MITLEDERNLATIICKDLEIPEQNKDLKGRIEAELVQCVLNQRSSFRCGDYERREKISHSGQDKQFLFCSPPSRAYVASVDGHKFESGKVACYET